MEGITWSYIHTLGFTHRELFLLAEVAENPRTHLQNFSAGQFPEWITANRKSQVVLALKTASLAQYEEKFDRIGAHAILHTDAEFPESLRHIPHVPFYLSVRGNLRNIPFLSIVGSRKSTTYGHELVKYFTGPLVRSGYGIVSGGALGIDAYAHDAAVKAGGYTIAVMGTGIDYLYPRTNLGVYDRILASGGALVSHFPLGTEANPYNFPIRNELIAGFSRGILLIEAKEKSGTLITAQIALDLGKDVFVPPADYTRENSLGTNRLLQQGCAKLVLAPEDILLEYDVAIPDTQAIVRSKFEDANTEALYVLLQIGYKHPDDLVAHSGLAVDQVLVILSILELDGHVRMAADGTYQISS